VAAAHPKVVSLWELGQAPSVKQVLHDNSRVVEFSLDGHTLLVGGADGQLRFYTPSSATGKLELRRSVLLGPKPILAVAYGNHSMLIALSAAGLYMYDTDERAIVQKQEDPLEKLTSLSMAPNRCWFAVGAQSGSWTGYLMGLCVSDTVQGFSSRFQWTADEDNAAVTALAFAPDSRFLVVATKSRRLRFHPLNPSWEAPRATGFFSSRSSCVYGAAIYAAVSFVLRRLLQVCLGK
jgi:WD40 repeat protein